MTLFVFIWSLIISPNPLYAQEPAAPHAAEAHGHCRDPRGEPGDPALPCIVGRVPLEDVSYYVQGRWQPDTFVRFSPDGRLLAIGSYRGYLRMWDVTSNRLLWEQSVAEGVVKRIDFSPDGRTFYFAEQSADAFFYAADTRSGEEKWRFRLADDLKTSPPPAKDDPYGLFRLPGCYRLKTLADGDLLLLGIHSWGDVSNLAGYQRLSRVYRFSDKGELRWAYPPSGPLPATIIYADADRAGRKVAFLVMKRGAQPDADHLFEEGTLVLLDGVLGAHLWHHTFEPLEPWFDSVSFWESISVSPDGELGAVGMHDGRTVLFDLEQQEIRRTYSFGAPLLISNVPVSASATYNHLASDKMVYFQTGASSVPYASTMQHVVAPPGPHPGATTLTAVGSNGRISWRYRSGHSFQNFWTSADGRWLLTSVFRDDERLGREAGAMLFDTHRPGGGTAKLVYFYQVEGKTHFHADLTRDGFAFALVETPYRDAQTDKIIGSYQVHIVR